MRSQMIDLPDRSHRRPSRRLTRHKSVLAILLLAVASAVPAAATHQPADRRSAERGVLRFYIESVRVEGIRRASTQVIVSESRLESGIAYTEAELRQAMYRINRLPFVIDAAFSLDRGSERGRHTLLITVEEVRSVFFGSDVSYATYGGSLTEASTLENELTDTLSAGMRIFAGQGVFFAAVGDAEDFQVGYERYQLRDRPILLRFAYAREGCCSARLQELGLDPGAAVWTAADESDRLELTIGLPLGGNHSLRFDASQVDTESAIRRPLDGGDAIDARNVEQRELELAWVFDSTDDPVFPSRGDALTAAVGVRWLEGDLSEPGLAPLGTLDLQGPTSGLVSEMSSRLVGLSLYGARHWPLSGRQTASLSLKLLLSRSEVEGVPLASVQGDSPVVPVPGDAPAASVSRDLSVSMSGEASPVLRPPGEGQVMFGGGDVDTLEAGFGARYSLGLWGPGKVRRLGELRWETVAELIYIESSPTFNTAADPLWGVSLSTGVALRNTWGIFRIGFSFLDFDGAL